MDDQLRYAYMVADLLPGPSSSRPDDLTSFGGKLVFTADSAFSRDIWGSDGTSVGTQLLVNFTLLPRDNPSEFVEMNDKLYFKSAGHVTSRL